MLAIGAAIAGIAALGLVIALWMRTERSPAAVVHPTAAADAAASADAATVAIPAAAIDAGLAAAAVDARTAAAPRRQHCACMPFMDQRAPDLSPLCQTTSEPRCHCNQRGMAVCLVEFVSCTSGEPGCSNGTRCPDASWTEFHHAGTPGGTCEGFIALGRPSSDARWECSVCQHEPDRAYRGVEGQRCEGFNHRDGKRYRGELARCRDRSD